MMDYVIRLSEQGIYDGTLLMFWGDEEVKDFLAELIANESRLEPLITGIWSWDEKDAREELILDLLSESPQPDGWTDQEYGLRPYCSVPQHVLKFTVQVRED